MTINKENMAKISEGAEQLDGIRDCVKDVPEEHTPNGEIRALKTILKGAAERFDATTKALGIDYEPGESERAEPTSTLDESIAGFERERIK